MTETPNKILLAGDFHGNVAHAERVFARAHGEADAIVQLGDYGFGWDRENEKCNFTAEIGAMAAAYAIPLYWIDGNHENFDFLEQTLAGLKPQEDGTYRLTDDPVGVFYIPRGTVLEWGGKRILCCGGAVSVDKRYRSNFVSWWWQEAITEDDVDKCADAGPADILLTHDFPWECNVVDRHLDPYWGEEANTNSSHNRMKVSTILDRCGAQQVFHGHLHIPYTEKIRSPYWDQNFPRSTRTVTVRGLDCDATSLVGSTHLLDLGAFVLGPGDVVQWTP